jgi:hypothetical protein
LHLLNLLNLSRYIDIIAACAAPGTTATIPRSAEHP